MKAPTNKSPSRTLTRVLAGLVSVIAVIWLISPPIGIRIVPNVISPNFDAHGQTYRQLTPEGPLP